MEKEPATDEEIKRFITEYKPEPDEDILDIVQGRLHYAVMDQVNHMVRETYFDNPEDIKKMILQEVEQYIDEFDPTGNYTELEK